MTIKSGSGQVHEVARRLISLANINRFSELQGIISEADELPAEDRFKVDRRKRYGKHSQYATHLERQHQLRLVYIPVAVYTATREEKLSFRSFSSDLSPIRYKKVAERLKGSSSRPDRKGFSNSRIRSLCC